MKKTFLIFFLLSAVCALAQDTCPLGLKNDSLPGQCAGYRDANVDSLCDLSEAEGLAAPVAPAAPRVNYHFWEILIITGILGLATELFTGKNVKRALVLQTAWNWLLLLSFLGSALSGLYFVLPFDQRPALGFNFSYWHTVVSIAFIAIGLYHTIRRFACLLGKPGPCLKNGACKEVKKRSK